MDAWKQGVCGSSPKDQELREKHNLCAAALRGPPEGGQCTVLSIRGRVSEQVGWSWMCVSLSEQHPFLTPAHPSFFTYDLHGQISFRACTCTCLPATCYLPAAHHTAPLYSSPTHPCHLQLEGRQPDTSLEATLVQAPFNCKVHIVTLHGLKPNSYYPPGANVYSKGGCSKWREGAGEE